MLILQLSCFFNIGLFSILNDSAIRGTGLVGLGGEGKPPRETA